MQQNHETERNEQHVCAAPGCTALCTGEYCRRHKPRHPMAVYLGRATGLKKEIRETKELLCQPAGAGHPGHQPFERHPAVRHRPA